MERPKKVTDVQAGETLKPFLFSPWTWVVVGLALFIWAVWTSSCGGTSCHAFGDQSRDIGGASTQDAIAPMFYSRSLNAGYGEENDSHRSDLGNMEGFKPGKVSQYAVPSGLSDGGLFVTGSWRSDPDGLTHVGADKGLVTAAFTEPAVDILGSFSDPARSQNASTDILVFFDGEYVKPDAAGTDVSIIGGRAVLEVSSLKTYHVLKDVPPGRHLLVLAAQADGFSIKKILFK